jgi:hypothetical protein
VFGAKVHEAIVPWWDAVAAGTMDEDAGVLTARDQESADLLQGMIKVVVSTTLDSADGGRA